MAKIKSEIARTGINHMILAITDAGLVKAPAVRELGGVADVDTQLRLIHDCIMPGVRAYASGVSYRLLADLTMLVHFTFLVFVVFGGFLAWRSPRVIWVHLLVAVWGGSTIAFSIRCPLTDIEDWARVRAGEARLTGTGFIDHYIEGVLYPQEYTRLLQAAAVVVVLGSWTGFVMRLRSPAASRGSGPLTTPVKRP